MYFLGIGQGAKVEAKFRLTHKPILLLIDDTGQHVDWPAATNYLFDDLAQELLGNKAAGKIVPRETLERLRQSLPDFDSRGAREIGELARAEQVVWIQVQDFLADPQIQDAVVACYFNATVKVLNVIEKERPSRVRLWPTSPQGQLVSVTLTGSEAATGRHKDGISRKLAEKLAEAIAKLFYDHRLGDFERQP